MHPPHTTRLTLTNTVYVTGLQHGEYITHTVREAVHLFTFVF